MKIKPSNWKGGFQEKIELIKILVTYGESVGLKTAKDLVDELAKGKTVEHPVKNEEIQNLRKELSKFEIDIEE